MMPTTDGNLLKRSIALIYVIISSPSSSSSNSPSSSAVASWYCWYSEKRSFMLDSISSIPSPVYQWSNAYRRHITMNCSLTCFHFSWVAVEFPTNVIKRHSLQADGKTILRSKAQAPYRTSWGWNDWNVTMMRSWWSSHIFEVTMMRSWWSSHIFEVRRESISPCISITHQVVPMKLLKAIVIFKLYAHNTFRGSKSISIKRGT